MDYKLTSYKAQMPTTRYQGSKRKLLAYLGEVFKKLEFSTCLDAFGGTGSITHLLRSMEKSVHYNDILPSNQIIAHALFANTPMKSTESDLEKLFIVKPSRQYKKYIAEIYDDIYFTHQENQDLDIALQNLEDLTDESAKNEVMYCLFQASLCKRPYNLFHRANLDMRTRNVDRSFGNKATWDRPFLVHMKKFHQELTAYRRNVVKCDTKITCQDAFILKGDFDLVYIDTPYAKSEKVAESNYFNFYHFWDAMTDYNNLPNRAVMKYCHRPIYEPSTPWHSSANLLEAFRDLFFHYKNSKLVISYRSDGYPSVDDLLRELKAHYSHVESSYLTDYKYVLSKTKKDTKEIVITAQN